MKLGVALSLPSHQVMSTEAREKVNRAPVCSACHTQRNASIPGVLPSAVLPQDLTSVTQRGRLSNAGLLLLPGRKSYPRARNRASPVFWPEVVRNGVSTSLCWEEGERESP